MPARVSVKPVVSVPWTDEERALLRQMWENGLGPVLIGRLLGRSKYSVTKQTQALHLPKMRQQPGETPPPEPRQRPPQPLRPGAHTLPPLPSELHDRS
jgi:hypothetical protein